MSQGLEELVAVLNSPLASAWFDANCKKRKIVQETLRRLPFPTFDPAAKRQLIKLNRSTRERQ